MKIIKKDFDWTPLLNLLWIFIWFIVYFALIWIYLYVISPYEAFSNSFVFYIGFGIFLYLVSQFIYSAIKKSYVNFDNFIIWILIYSGLLFLWDSILSFLDFEFGNFYLILLSITFTLSIFFLRRMKMGRNRLNAFRINRKRNNHAPMQIINGIILIVSGLLVFRFSEVIFLNWIKWPEGLAWSWLFGLILLLAGLFTIIAWWRNNVSMLTTRHTVRWN